MDDWYAIHFRLAPGFTHEDALEVLSRVEGHPAVGAWVFGDTDAPSGERVEAYAGWRKPVAAPAPGSRPKGLPPRGRS